MVLQTSKEDILKLWAFLEFTEVALENIANFKCDLQNSETIPIYVCALSSLIISVVLFISLSEYRSSRFFFWMVLICCKVFLNHHTASGQAHK